MDPNTVTVREPERISVGEVLKLMSEGEPVAFVDSRNPKAWAEADTKLPEAIRVPADEVIKQLPRIPRDRLVVTYCT
jgi:rhodanese-related sulfurtransferase